jgi:hypothetical protein
MNKQETNQTPAPKHGGGPATAAGKERSSQNSLKWGIFSGKVLVKTEFYAEDEEALLMREEELRAQFCPEGGLEEMCIQQILFHYQCLNRTNVYEVGCVEAQVREGEKKCTQDGILLKRAIERKIEELQVQQRRLADLNCRGVVDLSSLSECDLDCIMKRAKHMMNGHNNDALLSAQKNHNLAGFLHAAFGWDGKIIQTFLVKEVEGVIAEMESELSGLRSDLMVITASLGELKNSFVQQFLLVNPETFGKIERSRTSHSKHLQRAIETLMKFQVFRIQKMKEVRALESRCDTRAVPDDHVLPPKLSEDGASSVEGDCQEDKMVIETAVDVAEVRLAANSIAEPLEQRKDGATGGPSAPSNGDAAKPHEA